MNNSNEKLQNQFGAFCTRVLKNEAASIRREYTRYRDTEVSMDEISDSDLQSISVTDSCFMDDHFFEVLGISVVVSGNLLAEALMALPKGERDVILLSFFLGLPDREIGKRLGVVHQTVSKRRNSSLKRLREYLTKEGHEWAKD